MTQRPQHELFVSERPVRSDSSEDRVYARRRIATVIVLASVLGGGAYALWGGHSSAPSDIPTIATEGAYKEKPTDPGGIDIPHQDVRVYNQLESKNGEASPIEHLLPPPEAPKEMARSTPTVDAASVSSGPGAPAFVPVPAPTAPTPAAAPALAPVAAGIATPGAMPTPASVVPPAPAPVAVPTPQPELIEKTPAPKAADILQNAVPKSIETTVAPAPQPAKPKAAAKAVLEPKAPAAAPAKSIEQLIQNIKKNPSSASALSEEPSVAPPAAISIPAKKEPLKEIAKEPVKETAKASAAAGRGAIQLASLPNEGQARAMMQKFQQKYASEIGSAKLRIVRADLGSRGIYYRIQSQNLSENEANRICSSLKKVNAGCIFVAK